MKRERFEHQGWRVEYASQHPKEIPILAFHGFGRDLNDYKGFEESLSEKEYLVAINLFAHGNSTKPTRRATTDSLKPEEFKSLLQAFLNYLGAEKFGLMGYSMGGRIALCILEWFPQQTTRVVLMAPDGLKTNHLANFTTETKAGRALNSAILRYPGLLLKTTNVARKLRLIDKKLHRFVHVHMGTEKSRRQVHAVWHIYRHFKPNLPKIASLIQQEQLKFLMIFGKFDSVIKVELGERFAKMLAQPDTLVVLECGHQLMPDALEYLIESKPQ